jgi:hypothetical protein
MSGEALLVSWKKEWQLGSEVHVPKPLLSPSLVFIARLRASWYCAWEIDCVVVRELRGASCE